MSDPPSIDFAAEWEAALERRTTVERVYDVALQLAEPLRVAEIADRAGVTPDTTQQYLSFLAELGVVKKASDDPATYERNHASTTMWSTTHCKISSGTGRSSSRCGTTSIRSVHLPIDETGE